MLSGGEAKTNLKPGRSLAGAGVSKRQTCPLLSFSLARWPVGLVKGLLELLKNYIMAQKMADTWEETALKHSAALLTWR